MGFRRVGALMLGGLAGAACAHVEAPPGGPVDSIPPVVIAIRPESLSVNPELEGPVRFLFDERISERDIERAVLIAPAPGGVKVDKGRSSLEAEPRRGWQPGVIYHATLLPRVQDLFGNRIREPVHLVFSTGPEIPETSVTGFVVDPLTGRGVADVRVEARWVAEDLSYLAITDTAGGFRLSRIPAGEYAWVAFEDRNQNLSRDPFERSDSLARALSPADTIRLRFRILEPDSTPPAVVPAAKLADSVTVVVEFDDPLDPAFASDSIRASIVSEPAGEEIPPAEVWHAFEYERARVADDTVAAGPEPAEAEPRPQPSLYLRLSAPLAPGTYRVEVSGARNLHGLAGGGTATLEVEPPPPPPPEDEEEVPR